MSIARLSPKMELGSTPRRVRSSDFGYLTNQSVFVNTLLWEVAYYVSFHLVICITRTIHTCHLHLTGVFLCQRTCKNKNILYITATFET